MLQLSTHGDLYRIIIYTNETRVRFLNQKGVLTKQDYYDKIINNENNEVCGLREPVNVQLHWTTYNHNEFTLPKCIGVKF